MTGGTWWHNGNRAEQGANLNGWAPRAPLPPGLGRFESNRFGGAVRHSDRNHDVWLGHRNTGRRNIGRVRAGLAIRVYHTRRSGLCDGQSPCPFRPDARGNQVGLQPVLFRQLGSSHLALFDARRDRIRSVGRRLPSHESFAAPGQRGPCVRGLPQSHRPRIPKRLRRRFVRRPSRSCRVGCLGLRAQGRRERLLRTFVFMGVRELRPTWSHLVALLGPRVFYGESDVETDARHLALCAAALGLLALEKAYGAGDLGEDSIPCHFSRFLCRCPPRRPVP